MHDSEETGHFAKVGCLATLAVAGLLSLIAGCYAITNSWKYSDGARMGRLNKASEKGYVWKTYEGQLAMEGYIASDGSGTTSGANVWNFSVDGSAPRKEQDELFVKMREYAEKGTRVQVEYTEVVKAWPWRGATNHFVKSIKPAEEGKSHKEAKEEAKPSEK